MYPGVGKSGSPAPNPITGRPAARIALALASTASVADSEMAATRADSPSGRGCMAGIVPPGPAARFDGRAHGDVHFRFWWLSVGCALACPRSPRDQGKG